MSFHPRLLPTLSVALAALLLGAALFTSITFAQDGQPPDVSQETAASPEAANAALSTTFTYQGNLNKNGQPVNTTCSFQFSLWDACMG